MPKNGFWMTALPEPGPLTGQDLDALGAEFRRRHRCLIVRGALAKPVLEGLLAALPALRPEVHRNYLPGHKKGGSISRFQLDRLAPVFGELYRSAAFTRCLEQITGERLLPCPPDDPHTYALYYYTEEGDHIGWHYDNSYYRGRRYTVLIGLVERSQSRLEYQLDRPKRAKHEREIHSVATDPGTLVVFDGDGLYHRITPLGRDEERIALTLEYVTDPRMSPVWRFVSNMKDAIAYFGFAAAFGGGKRPRTGQ
jgi:hypothetical protein